MNRQIHVWGGLGSQLYALALAFDLRSKYGAEDITLIFHSAGVTWRGIELPKSVFKYRYVDDYTVFHPGSKNTQNRRKQILNINKEVFKRLSLLNYANSDEDFSQIKPRTTFFRGHYSLRTINKECRSNIIDFLYQSSFEDCKLDEQVGDSVAVHFRLGDLVNLGSKSYIEPERLAQEIIRVTAEVGNCNVKLLSDSPEIALNYLKNLCPKIQFSCQHSDPLSTLFELVTARFFIGTNSKLSSWATIIRFHILSNNVSILPQELRHQIISNLGNGGNLRIY